MPIEPVRRESLRGLHATSGEHGEAVALDQHAPGVRLPLLHEVVGQRHGPGDAHGDPLQGAALLVGLVHHLLVDGRDRRQHSGRGALHGADDEVRPGRGEQHESRSERHRERHAERHAEDVEEGQGAVDDLVVARVQPLAAHHGIRFEVAMAQHDALGQPGGPRRVLDDRQVVGVRTGMVVGQRPAVEQLLPRGVPGDGSAQLGALLLEAAHRQPQRGPHVPRHGLGDVDGDDVLHGDVAGQRAHGLHRLVPHDRDPGPVVLELMAQLGRRVERVVLDGDRPQAHDGVERDDVLRAVGQHEGHPVPAPHPEAAQPLGRPLDLGAQARVLPPRPEELEGGPLGVLGHGALEHVDQRRVRELDVVGDAVVVGRRPRPGGQEVAGGALGGSGIVCLLRHGTEDTGRPAASPAAGPAAGRGRSSAAPRARRRFQVIFMR